MCIRDSVKDECIKELSKEVKNGLGEAVGINFISANYVDLFIKRLEQCNDNDYFEKALETAIEKDGFKINGKTMGTYYIINVVDPPKNISKEKLKIEVFNTLKEINKKLSNWDNSSEVNFFNKSKTLLPVSVSEDLFNVIRASNLIHIKSEGFLTLQLIL